MSLPVCPECEGLNEVGADGKKATRLNPAMGPCPACGGSGVEATHTNYDTGEPCFCDVQFGGVPGPCIDAEPMVDGTDPRNGTG